MRLRMSILLPSTTSGGAGEASAYDLVIACYAGSKMPPYIAFISTGRAPVPTVPALTATAEVEGHPSRQVGPCQSGVPFITVHALS